MAGFGGRDQGAESGAKAGGKDQGGRAGGGGSGTSKGGGVRIDRVVKGAPVSNPNTGPMQESHIPRGPTVTKGSPADRGLQGLDFDRRFNTIKEHQDAVKSYQERNKLWDVADVLAGPLMDVQPPDINNPRSYSGGTYHTNTDVLGTAGMLAGAALGVPALGAVTGAISDYAGIPDVYHGGYGPQSWSGSGMPGIGSGNSSPKQGQTDGLGSKGKDSSTLNIANALSPGTQPNPQPSGAVTPQPTYVPAIQAPQPPAPWQGVPAQYPNMNAPKQPVQNYPGMRWIGGGMASRPFYG